MSGSAVDFVRQTRRNDVCLVSARLRNNYCRVTIPQEVHIDVTTDGNYCFAVSLIEGGKTIMYQSTSTCSKEVAGNPKIFIDKANGRLTIPICYWRALGIPSVSKMLLEYRRSDRTLILRPFYAQDTALDHIDAILRIAEDYYADDLSKVRKIKRRLYELSLLLDETTDLSVENFADFEETLEVEVS